MSIVKKKEFRIAVGLAGLGAVLFTLYKAYKHFFTSKETGLSPNQETQDDLI